MRAFARDAADFFCPDEAARFCPDGAVRFCGGDEGGLASGLTDGRGRGVNMPRRPTGAAPDVPDVSVFAARTAAKYRADSGTISNTTTASAVSPSSADIARTNAGPLPPKLASCHADAVGRTGTTSRPTVNQRAHPLPRRKFTANSTIASPNTAACTRWLVRKLCTSWFTSLSV